MNTNTENVDFVAGERVLPVTSLFKELIVGSLRGELDNYGNFYLAKRFLRRTLLNSRHLELCSDKFKKEVEQLLSLTYEELYEQVHGVQPPPVEASTNIDTKPKLKLVK